MTRGLKKTVSSIALATAAGLMATSAMAADLGGNCCADLEERVAELEATAARKGNRKVSLTVWGQVNQAILWHDSDEADAFRSDKLTSRTNDQDVSKFGFRGEAQIRPGLTAGYLLEIGIYDDKGLGSETGSLLIRQNNVYLDSEVAGRLTLGQANQVTDGVFTITLGNTRVTPGEMDEHSGVLGARYATTFATPYDGGRRKGVYYRTPSLAGFILSAGWSSGTQDKDKEYVEGKDFSVATKADSFDDSDDHYEIALRYAGEFNGVRVAAGIGYRKEKDNTDSLAKVVFDSDLTKWYGGRSDAKVWMGSASVMHTPTGLFVSGGYGKKDAENNIADQKGWWINAGIEKNWTGLGNTTIYGEYMKNDLRHNHYAVAYYDAEGEWDDIVEWKDQHDGHFWGIGIVQSIDAAATDLYLNMRRYELDAVSYHGGEDKAEGGDATVVTGGMIIRF